MDDGEYPIDITTDEFQHDFYDRISKANVVFFYLRHPVRFVKKIAFSIEKRVMLKTS